MIGFITSVLEHTLECLFILSFWQQPKAYVWLSRDTWYQALTVFYPLPGSRIVGANEKAIEQENKIRGVAWGSFPQSCFFSFPQAAFLRAPHWLRAWYKLTVFVLSTSPQLHPVTNAQSFCVKWQRSRGFKSVCLRISCTLVSWFLEQNKN